MPAAKADPTSARREVRLTALLSCLVVVMSILTRRTEHSLFAAGGCYPPVPAVVENCFPNAPAPFAHPLAAQQLQPIASARFGV